MRSTEPLRLALGLAASLALVLPVAGATAAPAKGPSPVGTIERIQDTGKVLAGGNPVSRKTNVVPRMFVQTHYADARLTMAHAVAECSITSQDVDRLQIAPRKHVILHMIRGELFCQLVFRKRKCPDYVTAGESVAVNSCDPVFALIVRKGKTTVKVTRGYAVVSGRSGHGQAIVLAKGQQVVVPAGGNPGVPRPIHLTKTEKKATAALQASLPRLRDTKPPVVSVAKGPSGFSGPTTSFLLQASEPNVEFTCALDGGRFHVCPRTLSFTGLGEGPHELWVGGVDAAGNQAAKPAVYKWTSDATPPTSSMLCNGAACSSGWYSSAVKVTLSASDSSSGVATIRYTLDGSEPTPTHGLTYAGPLTVSSPATIQYRAFDRAGNTEAAHAVKLQVDTTPPVVSVTAPKPGASVTSPLTVTATATDNVGVVKVTFFLDGNSRETTSASPYQTVLTFPSLSQGKHSVTARAFDNAGHTTDQSVTFNLVLPDLTVTMNPVYIYCPAIPCVPSVTFMVRNGGSRGADAGPSKVLIQPNVGRPFTLDVPSLAAGASATLTAGLPSNVSSVTVTADSTNVIPESQETNNAGPTTSWPPPA